MTGGALALPGPTDGLERVRSSDGTLIAVECAGSGPSLVIVHGGIGDHTRWTPMFPLLSPHFTVCAMDRRGHGVSGDAPPHALAREAEDVAAVVDSRPGPVFLLGHSYGGVAALEAAFLTKNIVSLILYEPPLQDRIDLGVVGRIETLLQADQRAQAVTLFLREVVRLPEGEVEAMRSRPSWSTFLAGIGSQPRELRALAAYRFEPKRMSAVRMPALLLTGSDTASPYLKEATSSLQASLPHPTLVVLKGQQHNAMDSDRPQLADAIMRFLLKPGSENRERQPR